MDGYVGGHVMWVGRSVNVGWWLDGWEGWFVCRRVEGMIDVFGWVVLLLGRRVGGKGGKGEYVDG